LSVEQGLSQVSITSILQDQYGFMWFGTQNGLNRFDGYQFDVFRLDRENLSSSLSSNFIRKMVLDTQDGQIWIGTNSGGVSRFDPKTERFENYQHNSNDPFGLRHDMVRSLYIDSSHNIWAGTYNGLALFDRENNRFNAVNIVSEVAGNLNLVVRAIIEDSEKTMWVGTNRGLYKRVKASEIFVKEKLFDHSEPIEVSSLLIEKETGDLWVGTVNSGVIRRGKTNHDLHVYDHDDKNNKSLSHNTVSSIMQSSTGEIWIGTSRGLNILNHHSAKQFLHFYSDPANRTSVSADFVSALFEDEAGVIWVGTWTAGINKVDPQAIQFFTINPGNKRGTTGLSNGQDGKIWFGSRRGLHYIDKNGVVSDAILHHQDVPKASVRDEITGIIASRFEPRIWLGNRQGLSEYKEGDKNIKPVALDNIVVYSVFEANDGSVWAGTYNDGLIQLERDTYKELRRISATIVLYMFQEENGPLWAATSGGMYRIEDGKEPLKITHDPNQPNSLSHDTVSWITKDSKDRYWVGTQGGGLNQMLLSDDAKTPPTFINYSTKDGFESEAVGAAIDDGTGMLWVSSTNGISRFNPETKEIVNFSDSEGAHKGGYYVGSGIMTPGNDIYFGGPHGLTRFTPSMIIPSEYIPPVKIVSLRLFNQKVEMNKKDHASPLTQPIYMTDKLKLSYLDSVVSFDFSALHYSSPQKNVYAYRLKGFDQQWNYVNADRRFATYTNLEAGAYEFQVKGTNKDGLWGEEATLLLNITPAWWVSWWANILFIGIILISIVLFFRWRTSLLRVKAHVLKEMVNEQTQALLKMNVQLEKSSRQDYLTRLSNRRDFVEQSQKEINRFVRHKRPFCIMLIDVDFFKKVNDNFGHEAGDQALVFIADKIKESTRSEDIAARWGGEEFIILLPDTEYKEGRQAAEKIRLAIDQSHLLYNQQEINLNITAGIVVIKAGESLKECISRADDALYKGKNSGRNSVN
jgi:diguanylate cyclase (GGDEF)-like protein